MNAIGSLLRLITSHCPGACSSRCNIGLWVMLCEYFVWIFYIIFQTNPSTTILSHSEWYFDSAGCHPKREYCSVTVASVNTLNFTAVFHQANANTLNPQHDLCNVLNLKHLWYILQWYWMDFSSLQCCFVTQQFCWFLFCILCCFPMYLSTLPSPLPMLWKYENLC